MLGCPADYTRLAQSLARGTREEQAMRLVALATLAENLSPEGLLRLAARFD